MASCELSLACDRRGGSNRYGVSILRTDRENPKDVMGARDVGEEVGTQENEAWTDAKQYPH